MLFAAVLDAGLIPLYVFTAIVSDVEHESKAYGWDTLFGTKEAAEYIIHATFLACSTVGGLHLISLGLDLYLAVIFRKISKLPPDMNPLEDNLTSRARKRNKSELMEKHLSHDTTASANANRQSMAQDPLVSTRTVPFMHTRTDSASTLSSSEFRGTDSPRSSYYSAKTHVQSRSELPSQQMLYHDQATRSRTNIARTPAQKRSSTLSRPQSVVFDTAPVTDQSQLEVSDPRQRDPSGVSSLSDGNWCAYPSSPPSPETYPVDAPGGLASVANRAGTPMIPDVDDSQWDNSGIQHRGDTVIRHRGEYAALDSCDHDDEENRPGRPLTETIHIFEHDLGDNQLGYPLEEANEQTRYPTLNPLEMNPPTPQPPESSISSQQSKNSLRRIALADIPNPPSGRSTPSKGSKPRTYGELEKTAVAPAQRVGSLRGKNAQANDTEKKTKTRWRRKTGNYESLNIHDDESNSENDGPADRENGDRKGRVVSNTGIDLGTGLGSSPAGYGSYIAGLGVGRRREVSGKVAEEGRGGSSLGSENPDSASKAKRLSKQGEYRSAGWARFKGL